FRYSIRLGLAAASLMLTAQFFARAESSPVTTPRLEQIRAEHRRILDQLNEKDAKGKVMELDEPRVPGLVRKGWDLAGVWAAEYLETHPKPSTRDLKRIFEGFAPKPRGVKSQYGNFLEYSDYSFEGSAVRVGPASPRHVAEGTKRGVVGLFIAQPLLAQAFCFRLQVGFD